MRSIAAQLVTANLDLLPHVINDYVDECQNPSLVTLRKLLPQLLSNIQSSRIIIDGVDECDDQEQKRLLSEMIRICQTPESSCKILFSSREMEYIKGSLRSKPTISLTAQRKEVDHAIGLYIKQNLNELRERLYSIGNGVFSDIEEKMMRKSGGKNLAPPRSLGHMFVTQLGMFLWARLVTSTLKDECFTIQELQTAVETLPEGIEEA
jgi:hypothetical protein